MFVFCFCLWQYLVADMIFRRWDFSVVFFAGFFLCKCNYCVLFYLSEMMELAFFGEQYGVDLLEGSRSAFLSSESVITFSTGQFYFK